MIKGIYKEPRANNIFNEKRQGCSSQCNKSRKRNKSIQIGKEVKLLFPDGTIAYLENLMQSTKKAARISEFSKVARVNIQNHLYFHILVLTRN